MNARSEAQERGRVHVVDDDRLARESLEWLMRPAGLDVCSHDSGLAFLEQLDAGEGGCVVLDVRMPDINGLELQERLRAAGSMLPVIIVTGHADVAMAVRAMKAGAFDFIEKPYPDSLMLERVQSALARDADARRQREQRAALRARFDGLTPREQQVLAQVLKSRPNKVIAAELGISIKTVELHRANLMDKLGVRASTELVRLAVLAGID